MKAAVYKDVGVLRVEDVPEPQPGPDQIKVKIAYCGICGTDPEIIAGHFPPIQPPSIIGHEASGTIVALGSNVQQGYKVGQRVAMNFQSFCGACYYCRNKMEHFCTTKTMGTGSFAEFAVYKESGVYALPDDIPMEIGALLEPVSVAVHATDLANVYPGSSVAILGGGVIGLLILELALKAGATRTLVSEPMPEKRQLARSLGADVVVDPLNENLEEMAKKLTEGRGFNTVVEASGKLGPAKQAISLADKCGTVLWAAVYPSESEIPINPYYMYANELTLRSIRVAPYSFPRAMSLLSKLELRPLITHTLPLQDIEKALEIHKKGQAVKILIQP